MNILLLSPYPFEILDPVIRACSEAGDSLTVGDPSLDTGLFGNSDWVVLWGFRRILTAAEIAGRNILNIHISYLPYNRGASPNLWSWYEDTPSGVSIHRVAEEVDKGPLLARRVVIMKPEEHTLRTSYDYLQAAAGRLFYDSWPKLREGGAEPIATYDSGSFHTIARSQELLTKFSKGIDTPCTEVRDAGRKVREAA